MHSLLLLHNSTRQFVPISFGQKNERKAILQKLIDQGINQTKAMSVVELINDSNFDLASKLLGSTNKDGSARFNNYYCEKILQLTNNNMIPLVTNLIDECNQSGEAKFNGYEIRQILIAKKTTGTIPPSLVSANHENTFLFIDDETKNTDIDGDKIPDISHSDCIAAYLRQNNPEIKLKFLAFNPANEIPDIVKHLENIAYSEDINKYKLLNLSYGIETKYKDMFGVEKIDNVSNWYNEVYDICKNDPFYKSAHKLLKYLKKIIDQNVKVYTASGNAGKEFFNIFNAIPGINSVGATDDKGNKASWSCEDNNTKWAQGVFGVVPINVIDGKAEGYDITGDGKIDVMAEETSGKGQFVDPEIKEFVGQPLKNYLFSMTNFDPDSKNLLVSLHSDEAKTFFSDEDVQIFKQYGNYASVTTKKVYDVDENGNIVYDPDRSKRKNQIHYLEGTSIACPQLAYEENKPA